MSRDESRRSKRSRVDRDYGVGPAADIMTYDDERTLDEEEALEASEDTHNELSHLQKESDMPLKDLLIMYGYGDISCDDANKANDDDGEEDEEEEDDDDDEDEDEDDPASCEPDLKQFYTEMVKAEENGANKKSPLVKSEPDKIDETTDPPASIDTNKNPANEDIKMEVTTNAEDATPPDPPSSNSCNTEANTIMDNVNSNTANAGSGGGGPSRLLRSVSRPQSEEEEDDCDYSPDEDEWKKTIMVGSDYQAAIPEGLCKYDDALPYENEDKMLWEPYHVKEEEVEEFLERAQLPAVKGSSLPSGRHVRDDEQALYLLLQCGYNLEEALRRRRMNALPSTESVSLWSEEECHNFESGLRNYGKDFHLIQKNKVRTRSVGELVQFYYLWKKTERHDIFTYKARLEKKKYALHPGITDYMDRFLEEQEGVRDRSSSPNVHCLLYGDNKRQRTNTNSTNNEEQSKAAVDNWDRSNNTTTSTSTTTTATVTSSASTTNSSNSGVTGGDTTVNNDSVDPLAIENHQQNSLKASVTLAATAFITSSSTSTTSSNIITTSSSSSVSPSFSVPTHQRNNLRDPMQQETIVTNSHQPILNNNEESVAARSPESILPHLPP